MKYVKTIEELVRTELYCQPMQCYITCREYASVWRFSARICGWAEPSATNWSYKKSIYKSYEKAKQSFLSDLADDTSIFK